VSSRPHDNPRTGPENARRLGEAFLGLAERFTLFGRLALAMSHIGVFPRGLGVRLRLRGLFPSLLVLAFAVMLSGHLVTFGGVLVMFRPLYCGRPWACQSP